MSGKRSRTKGHNWERQVSKQFNAALDLDSHRGLQTAGARVPDVQGVPGLWIECKCGKLPNVRAALKQADKDKSPSLTYSVTVIKDDRCRPFVAMYLDDFLEVLGPWLKQRRERGETEKCHLTKTTTEQAESGPAKPGEPIAGTINYSTKS